MLMDSTPGVEDIFDLGPVTGYIGFDPTAPSLTIGNMVQVMLLDLFQRTGNKPIVLMGGATGLIGDPSFKNSERDLKSLDEVRSNIDKQKKQFESLLRFSGDNAAIFVDNYDFYKEMNVLEFLRDVGKTLTVNYMASKESVKKRMESGISFTEFSYQLLQGYDFQVLYANHECKLQMGGSDQWGNITAGTEFIRRNVGGKAFAVTTPLLTKSDGTKFGKSEQGNIWLDATLTNPFQFYQFWINADDADVPKLLRYFSRKSKDEIQALDTQISAEPNEVKKILAAEVTAHVHGHEQLKSVQRVTELLYGRSFDQNSIRDLKAGDFEMLKSELPHFTVSNQNSNYMDLLTDHTGIFQSKGEAKRAFQGNAIQINRKKVTDPNIILTADDFILGQFLLIENGKKNKYVLEMS